MRPMLTDPRSGVSEPTCEEESGHGGQCTGREDEVACGNELVVGLGLSDCNGAGASCVPVHFAEPHFISDTTIQQNDLLVKLYLGSAFPFRHEAGWRTLLKNS